MKNLESLVAQGFAGHYAPVFVCMINENHPSYKSIIQTGPVFRDMPGLSVYFGLYDGCLDTAAKGEDVHHTGGRGVVLEA